MKIAYVLFIVFSISLECVAHTLSDKHFHDEAELVREIANCTDCLGGSRRVDELSQDSVYSFADIVRDNENVIVAGRSVCLLSRKYVQFSGVLSDDAKLYLVQTVLSRISELPDFYMDRSSMHEALVEFNHPLVLKFAKEHVNAENPRVRLGAQRIIDSFRSNDSPTVEAVEVSPIETPVIAEVEIKEPTEIVVAEPTKEVAEKSTNWLLWLIGALVILGGLVVAVRRKN